LGWKRNSIATIFGRSGFSTESSKLVQCFIGDLGTIRTYKLRHRPNHRCSLIETTFPNIRTRFDRELDNHGRQIFFEIQIQIEVQDAMGEDEDDFRVHEVNDLEEVEEWFR
jgi:hypothetical protein